MKPQTISLKIMQLASEYIELKEKSMSGMRQVPVYKINANSITRHYSDNTCDVIAHWQDDYEAELIFVPRIARLKQGDKKYYPPETENNNISSELMMENV
jgi:hypothetical protein